MSVKSISLCRVAILCALCAVLMACGPKTRAPAPTLVPLVPQTAQPSVPPTATQAVAPPTMTAAPPTQTPPPPTTEAAPPDDVANWPQEVIRLGNEARSQQGLPPFTSSPLLMQAAQIHADDCSQSGSCGGTGSDGSDVRARVTRLGGQYTAIDQAWGINWEPVDAVNWWLDTTPPDDWPRRLLLSETYTEIGIGIAPADWGYYFIAVFARP